MAGLATSPTRPTTRWSAASYEWELMPLGIDQRVGTAGLEPARMGPAHRQDPARAAVAGESAVCTKTAEYGPQIDDEYLYKVVDAIDEVAKETGKSVPQIALNWLLQRPTVASVIIGARNEEQLKQNLGQRAGTSRPSRSRSWMRRAR